MHGPTRAVGSRTTRAAHMHAPGGGDEDVVVGVSLLLPSLSLHAADAATQLHARPTMMRLQATIVHQTKHQHKGINLAPGSEGGWADARPCWSLGPLPAEQAHQRGAQGTEQTISKHTFATTPSSEHCCRQVPDAELFHRSQRPHCRRPSQLRQARPVVMAISASRPAMETC